jgi:hypothetical protein
MTPSNDKQGPGIPLTLELSRRENDLLHLAAKKDKRDPRAQVRWLIEAYGLGLLRYSEEGASTRTLLRVTEEEVHYPDSVSVNTSRAVDKE